MNDRFVLPTIKLTLVRVKNSVKVFELKNIIYERVFIEKLNVSTLNFLHNDQIINGYDSLREYKELSTNDDIDGKFYSLPNDLTDTTNVVIDRFHSSNNLINQRLDSFEFSVLLIKIFLILFVFIFFLTPFLFVICFHKKRNNQLMSCKRKENKLAFSQILPLELLANRLHNDDLDIKGHRDYDLIEQGDSVTDPSGS